MDIYLAIDVGGTQMRVAGFPIDQNIPLFIKKIPTQENDQLPLERLLNLVSSIWQENARVRAIGLAAPGPTDPYKGIVIEAPNIPGWLDLPLKEILEQRFNTPVALGNDANLAALGEWKFGAGIGHHHLLYLTISTGIGGGVIIDDKLLLGVRGLAAELGHITVDPEGPICGCGHRGHLEAVASGPAIIRWVEDQMNSNAFQGSTSILRTKAHITGKDISTAAMMGDKLAQAALARAGTFIGKAVADYLHIFNPSIVIIGGGVSQSGSYLLQPLRTGIEANALSPYYYQDLTLTTAKLGDQAGLMGALALAQSYSLDISTDGN
jgi:glucokinase